MHKTSLTSNDRVAVTIKKKKHVFELGTLPQPVQALMCELWHLVPHPRAHDGSLYLKVEDLQDLDFQFQAMSLDDLIEVSSGLVDDVDEEVQALLHMDGGLLELIEGAEQRINDALDHLRQQLVDEYSDQLLSEFEEWLQGLIDGECEGGDTENNTRQSLLPVVVTIVVA